MLRDLRPRLRLLLVSAAALTGCADVLGLDEPTVRGDGGGGPTSSSSTRSTTSGTTTGSTTAGPGGGEGASGSTSSAGGDGGGSGCTTPADCDDDNPCTDDGCSDAACSHAPVPDGQLIEDPGDCRTITCAGGEVSDVPNDAEDPDDANPPCETTICQAGAPTPVFAPAGTTCGPSPQECDGRGLCIGCDPSPPDTECGSPTECAAPTCVDPGVCDPGFLPADTPLADPLVGDCQAPACTGDSAASVSVADDTDVPADLPCGDRACASGAPTTATVAAGMPCLGQSGVCDGLGTAAANCRVCRNTTDGLVDAGCAPPLQHCQGAQGGGFGDACRACTADTHCATSEVGTDCLPSFVCGCNGGSDCIDSPNGDWCFTGPGVCGCENDLDCDESARGQNCILATDLCGCMVASDCQTSPWGEECLAGNVCGCLNDADCGPTETCNLTTNRCED